MPVTVTIDDPPNNSDVPGGGNVTTCGFVTPAAGTAMTATCDGLEGTLVEPPPHDPPYDWAFDFQGVTVGEWRTLTVEGTNGSESGSASHNIRCVE